MQAFAKKLGTVRRVVRAKGLNGVRAVVKEKLDRKPSVQFAKLAPIAVPALARHGLPDTFIHFLGGIGDDLLITVLLRELRLRNRRRLWVMSKYPDIYRNNPDVDLVVPQRSKYEVLMKHLNVRVVTPWYSNYHPVFDRDDPYPEQHIISMMCQKAGITGPITLKPYIELDDAELKEGELRPHQIAIQTGGMTATHAMMNKNWFAERYQEVVSALSPSYNFIQVGSMSDPPLQGALDLRGRTSLRESAAILARSLAFVGQVGFLMHLARAVDCRSVILYGGREAPDQSGYSCNENLYREVPCSPCWRLNSCSYDRECMRMISAADVIGALEKQLARHGTPLPVDTAVVTPDQIERTNARYRDAIATHKRAWAILEDVDRGAARVVA